MTADGTDLAGRIVRSGPTGTPCRCTAPATGWVNADVYFDGHLDRQRPDASTDPADAWVLIYQRAFLQEMGVQWTDPNARRLGVEDYGDQYAAGRRRARRPDRRRPVALHGQWPDGHRRTPDGAPSPAPGRRSR